MFCELCSVFHSLCVFLFNDTATTEIYTLSLHDALPISYSSAFARTRSSASSTGSKTAAGRPRFVTMYAAPRSEEHTSELQSLRHLVCRLLLEKKKKKKQLQMTRHKISK